MSSDRIPSLVQELTFVELQSLCDAANARMRELREIGVSDLLKRFEAEAATFGMSAHEVVGAGRKCGRKSHRPKANAPAADAT